ncbi:hypothetical protein CR203_09320 [Salipaludibacillus neizhouensis]|uniref:Uncharacterized protein n=1 Tax=Salipaludibacillus neizhouensis TaxID=885475 RepID=A0A3A9K5L8_9BACI|nr:hypothetical protein [Salipaludibacillus neizhouensis]RKL67539.1 hypothetical protein CR203_09320 [Salipaludibacillus neizhouensis]
MDLRTVRKKLEELAHQSQELKNSYHRLDEMEKKEFKVGYSLDRDVDELAEHLFEWSETQFERNK